MNCGTSTRTRWRTGRRPLPCAIITLGLDRASFDREVVLIYHKRRSQLARSRNDCSMKLIPQLSAHHRVSCQQFRDGAMTWNAQDCVTSLRSSLRYHCDVLRAMGIADHHRATVVVQISDKANRRVIRSCRGTPPPATQSLRSSCCRSH